MRKRCRNLSKDSVPPSLNSRVAACCQLCEMLELISIFLKSIQGCTTKCTGLNHFCVARFSGPHKSGEGLSAWPPLPHVTILWTSSSSMACIIRHRRHRGAPQKEAGAHTKTFAFLHLIRVVIARQRERPAPRYLASFYRWRLKRASKCQLLTAGEKKELTFQQPPLSFALCTPSLPPVHPLLRACLAGAL